MTSDKLLFVSCQIPQARLWELLRLLEAAKAGNVEVRPVVPIAGEGSPVLDGKFFSKRKKSRFRKGTGVSVAVSKVMAMKENRRPIDVAMEIGANPKSVYSAFLLGTKRGIYKKTDEGYMRIKEDE